MYSQIDAKARDLVHVFNPTISYSPLLNFIKKFKNNL